MSQPESQQRNALSFRVAASVWKYHLLAAAVSMGLLYVAERPIVAEAFGRLGWRLGPWSVLPYPGSTNALTPNTDGGASFIAFTGILSLWVGLIHGVCLLVAAGLHAWFGWPRYWRVARARLDLNLVWAESVRRSWWAWPLGQGIGLLFGLCSSGLWYLKYPAVDGHFVFVVAKTAGICVIFGVVAARILHATIRRVVLHDDWLCVGCGYPLRGLPIARCPECGRHADLAGALDYGLFRGRPWRRTGVARALPAAVVLLMFLTPVWVPLGLATLPARWVGWLPAVVRSERVVFEYDHNAFPIRSDAACVVRKGRALAVLRFNPTHPDSGECLIGYWADESDSQCGKPPDAISSGRFSFMAAPDLIAGPWRFPLRVTENGLLWLTRADSTYSLEVYESHQLPEYLRRLDEQGVWATATASFPAASQAAGSAPSSRSQGSAVNASRPGG